MTCNCPTSVRGIRIAKLPPHFWIVGIVIFLDVYYEYTKQARSGPYQPPSDDLEIA